MRRLISEFLPVYLKISIHAPRVGCDPDDMMRYMDDDGFQSTHPVWGATEI